jgi:hypothetical protein
MSSSPVTSSNSQLHSGLAATNGKERMSSVLARLAQFSASGGKITLQSLVDSLGDRSHVMAILFLAIPFVQPIPMLGLSTIFGAAIITIAATYALGKKPWIPAKFGNRELPHNLLQAICDKGSKVFQWLERWVRPRGKAFHRWTGMKTFAALCVVLCAALLALPLPIPASNTVPTIPIILLALGLLEEDGWFVVAGYIGVGLALLFFGTIIIGPFFGLNVLVESGFLGDDFTVWVNQWFGPIFKWLFPPT